jgi:hypothetical protein
MKSAADTNNPCKIENVAYLLPLVSFLLRKLVNRVGLGKTPLVATSNLQNRLLPAKTHADHTSTCLL